MKIKEFDEKVRIGSEVVFEGKICHVRDLNRKTHEASLGRSELWVRCSEFELYTGGEVPCYVEEKDPLIKMGRPGNRLLPSSKMVRGKSSHLSQKRQTS